MVTRNIYAAAIHDGFLTGKNVTWSVDWYPTNPGDDSYGPSVETWQGNEAQLSFPIVPETSNQLYEGYIVLHLYVDGVSMSNSLRMNVMNNDVSNPVLVVPNSINIPQTVYQMDVPSTPYYGVWYNVVLQQAGQLSINTNGTIGDLDTMLGLYAANGTLIATNDDGGDEALSMITSILPAGTYYFVVTQYQTTFFDSRFDFQCFKPIPTGIKISATF